LADQPKSFWSQRRSDVIPTPSHLDPVGLRVDADLIRWIHRAGLNLVLANEYELWELAAAVGLDLIDASAEEVDALIEAKKEEWDATHEQRDAAMRRFAERKAERRKR
jgi:hypothetical protein